MKKGSAIMLGLIVLLLCLVIGIFIGRNTNSKAALLPVNNDTQGAANTDTAADHRLDINSATKAQLMELPGIGEKLAEQIISYRSQNGDFKSIDDLILVEGIGKKKLSQIEHMIRAGG